MDIISINVHSKKNNKRFKEDIEKVVLNLFLSLDEQLYRYDLEVIKAIAVLLRSQLIKYVRNSKYADTSDEFVEIDEEFEKNMDYNILKYFKAAVKETKGIIVTTGNKAVDLYFTSCCGGGTANSEDVLAYRVNYLRRVLCRYCEPVISEKKIVMNDYTKGLNLPCKEEMWEVIKDVERDETGRIINISFLGKKMSGEEFAKKFQIQSNRIYFIEDSILFKAIGEGMGLGICLQGANKIALGGGNFKDIINYYYTGVTFEDIAECELSSKLKDKIIAIDAGHGGSDMGYINSELCEKDINIKIAGELKKKLEDIGCEVIFIRDGDSTIPMGDRVNKINEKRPEFFISIHQNSFMSPGINGVESYCYNRDEEAMKMANLICKEISTAIDVKNRGVRTGDYYLLRECKTSGVIVECMYITGDSDSKKYNSDTYKKIGEAIYKAICKYYGLLG